MKMPQMKPHAHTRDNVHPRGRCRAFQETEPPTFMDESHENAQNRTLGPLTIHETPFNKTKHWRLPLFRMNRLKTPEMKAHAQTRDNVNARPSVSRFSGNRTTNQSSTTPNPHFNCPTDFSSSAIFVSLFPTELFVPYPVFVHLDSIFHGAPRGYVVS